MPTASQLVHTSCEKKPDNPCLRDVVISSPPSISPAEPVRAENKRSLSSSRPGNTGGSTSMPSSSHEGDQPVSSPSPLLLALPSVSNHLCSVWRGRQSTTPRRGDPPICAASTRSCGWGVIPCCIGGVPDRSGVRPSNSAPPRASPKCLPRSQRTPLTVLRTGSEATMPAIMTRSA